MKTIHEIQPTMNLRFIEREVIRTVSTETQNSLERVKVRILQQQFASVISPHTEWRDVPLEMEE
jgi:hypothetical protein